ncbi:MAG: T9SS type A sorting domain-containing protein [Bacteroidales bacterium]|nr:T9SS type A sorting domain-containing protein [Bacteroidales bacterium]
MKTIRIYLKGLMFGFMFLLGAISFAQTHILTGNVSGTWTRAGSPYLIEGDISISSGQSLTVEPGVLVEFQDHYKFNVQGQLLAVGTRNDSIRFTIDDTTGFRNLSVPYGGWHGMRFGNSTPGDDTSRISFCRLEWGKAVGGSPYNNGGAIAVESYDNLVISNSLISHSFAAYAGGGIAISNSAIIVKGNTIYQNGAGFACGGIAVSSCDPQIINNKIENNVALSSGGGLGLSNGADPNIIENIIVKNSAKYGAGIQMITNCNPLIRNNLIYKNTADQEGGGVDLEANCNPIFINNTIVYNSAPMGGGIDCEVNSSPVFRNTIIWWNTGFTNGSQVHLFSENSDPHFYYCDIEGGSDAFGLWYGGGTYFTYSGSYENNIDHNPDSTSQNEYLFLLADSSPCIDAGDPDAIYNDNENPANPGLAKWPSKGLLRNDIGIYGGPGCLPIGPITGVEDKYNFDLTLQKYQLYQSYPNPFTESTTIIWQLPKDAHVILKVYDFTGREVKMLVDSEQAKGEHKVKFDATGLPAGVYFYQLRANRKVETKKMVYLK